MTTISSVLRALWRTPGELLVRRWNWKAALCSSVCRSSLFLFVNLNAGAREAAGAMAAEFVYRALTAGFYGALTQSFRKVEPPWRGDVAATLLLIGVSHTLEFALHLARGTPNLLASIGASIVFTACSTLFNLNAMRQGVLVAGSGGYSLLTDVRLIPGVIAGLVDMRRARLTRCAGAFRMVHRVQDAIRRSVGSSNR